MFRVVLIACVAFLLGGCTASDKLFEMVRVPVHGFVDKLPDWAGGKPEGLPPKPTDPGYLAYRERLEGKDVSVPSAEPLNPLH
jgi:hypothetical protein